MQAEVVWDENSQSMACIRLYRLTPDDEIAVILAHEWSHLLWFASPDIALAFTGVGDLDRFVTVPELDAAAVPMDTAELPKELWAILGEKLMSPVPLVSPAMASANPIRATLFSVALAGRLDTLPTLLCSSEHLYYSAVLKFIFGNIMPKAVARLREMEKSDNINMALRARSVLCALCIPDEGEDLLAGPSD
jgi:hypothetical protein